MRSIPPPSCHHQPALKGESITMLDLVMGRAPDCTGVSRREFLRSGGLAALGLSLPRFLRLQSLAAASSAGPPNPKAPNSLPMVMPGGPIHHESFATRTAAPSRIAAAVY